MTITVTLCRTCQPEARTDALERAVEAEGATLRLHDCLNVCKDPSALALQGPGRAVCIFSGVDPEADLADIIATLRAYRAAPGGWISDARPCGRLRHCLIARVPARER